MTTSKETLIETRPDSLEPIGLERVEDYARTEISRIQPLYVRAIEARHALFNLTKSALSHDTLDKSDPTYRGRSIEELLYEDPTYNTELIKAELRTRTPGSKFHDEFVKFDDTLKESDESLATKRAWRTELIKIGQEFGGYGMDLLPGKSMDPLERLLGMRESQLSSEHPVDAQTVIVPGAAGISNYLRIQDTIRNIRSGAVVTEKIIITAGERTIDVNAAERKTLNAKNLPTGDTEYEALQNALEYLTGASIVDSEEKTIPAPYGSNTPPVRYKECTINLDGKIVAVTILEAAYDRDRRFENGTTPDRANTDETFLAAIPLLDKGDGTLLVESHDVWIPYQEVIAQKTLGLFTNKSIIATGPFKDDRLKLKEKHHWAVDSEGQTNKEVVGFEDDPDIMAAQAMLDEIAKKQGDLTKLIVQIEDEKQASFLRKSAEHAGNQLDNTVQ